MGEQAAPSEVVLVTGFPRLVARLVVDELLRRDGEVRVRLLVRTKFLADAEAFARSLAGAERVALLEGDAASIDLGLSGLEFRAVASEVDYIQHHAQVSFEGADDRSAEALNIQGAREVLELARAATHLKRLVHHSSATVAGDRTGTVREEDLDEGQQFRSAIEQTKFKAERLMRRAMGTVPISVIRPSLTVGHSVTGEIDRLDGLYLLILLILTSPMELTLPLPGRGETPLNVVPVDYVARASVALMYEPGAAGRTFHLVDPAPLSARRVYELIARAAGHKLPRGFIPVNLTRALLRTPGLERFAKSPRAFLEQLSTPVTYLSQGAREILVPLGIECPPFEKYVDVLVAHVRERMAARRAQRDSGALAEVDDPLA
jgi:thioester reductase-like protein